jgi:hypothetical protein
MQSALDIQSTFPDMSRSTIAGHLPHSALELRRAETTTSTFQLQAPQQNTSQKITISLNGQSVRQQRAASDNLPDDSRPNAEAETGFIPTFADSTSVIPCPEMTPVGAQHTVTRKTCFACPQMLCKKSSSAVC